MKHPLLPLFATTLLATALAAPPARGEALDASPFAWRVPIAVSGYAGASPLTNFPVLVTLAAGSPSGFDYADCAEDGSDLRFADADGAILPHEIDTWDPSGESFVWVGLPVLTNGAAFSLYYGGAVSQPAPPATNVWTRYAAVFHGGATIADATGNAADVRPNGVLGVASGGRAGGAMDKGANVGLQFSNPVASGALASAARVSVSGWFRRSNSGSTAIVAANKNAWGETGFLGIVEGGTYFSVAVDGTHQGATGKGALAKGEWGHLAFAYDTTNVASYFDGEPIFAKPNGKPLADKGDAYWAFGSYNNQNKDCFQGAMDELRVFDGIASADWIRAEHDSVADPAAFAVRGAVAPVDGEAPRFGALAASDEGGTATFSVSLAAPGFGGAVPTAVSVFYGTNGVDWTELSLGSTNAAATRTGSASGLTGNVRYLWYAVASATQDGATKTATSPWRSFVSKAVDPAGNHMSFTATVDWDGAPAENVPVLLRLSEAAVRGFYYGDVTSSGFEIVDAAGRLLPFEIDTWDETGESLVWVLLPDYRDGATFTVRYGAPFANAPAPPEEVWADYKGVWHMESASPADASGSGNDGTAAGAAASAPGLIGSALSLQAKTDYVKCGTNLVNSELAAGFTVAGWANFADLSGYHALFGKNLFISVRSSGDSEIQVTTPGKLDHNLSGLSLPAAGTWGHFALTFSKNASNGCRLYVNGALAAQKDAGDIANLTDPTEMWLGRNQWGYDQNFKGLLDEMRLRAGIRSANEIAAEYHAMADAAALVCGAAEPSDADLPVIGDASAAGGAGSAAFSVVLDRPGFGGAAPTSVSVFYGTNGVDWTELVLGSTNEAATLTGTATGLRGNTVYLWYAAATATQDGVGKSADTSRTPRTVLTGALPAPEAYRTFTATVEYDGAAATNVPVLLRLSENAIEGFDYDDVTASGFEIVDADGRLLPFEIDTWDTNGESLLWVRLPVWEDGATIVVRYGAEFANSPTPASGTWADYVGVWHLNDTNAASAYGSYPNSTATAGIDGEKAQASIADEAGVFGKSVKICDAARQGEGFRLGGVFVPDSGANSPLDLGDTFVLSGWFRHKNQDYYWDKLFAKRGKANNDANVPPTGAFTVETGSEGSSDKLSVFGGGGTYKSVGLNSTLRNTWSHLTFVYDGSTVSVYQDGAPCGSGTVNPVTDNDGRLCFGNMTGGYGDGTGDCAWCGWIDEVRLADGTPSAARIAAEYAAMADPAALSYSRATTIDAATPELSVPTVARNADGSFAVSVAVSGNVPASVACLVGGSSVPMSTVDAELPMTYSADLTGLADGTYVATVRAISTTGNEAFSDCPAAFHAGALAVEVLSDADEGSLMPGVFRVSRADADPTGLPALTFDVAFSGDGLAAVVAPGIATAAIPAGAAYVDIAVAPVHAPAVDTDTTVALAVSGAYVGRPSGATMTVVNAAYDPAVRYVSTIGSDENHGGTPEWPKKTIGAAVSSLENVARTETCTVHVAPGLYPNASPVVVTNAIRVLGDDPDPSRTVVSNIGEVGFYGSHNQRLFTINHADAFVANLTMQAGIAYYDVSGGNFYVGEKGGTVSNCVVEAGVSHSNGIGGGGQMKGGLVTHTVFRKNRGNSSSANGFATRTGVLEMNRTSRAENCLFEDNPQTAAVFLIKLNDQSVMRNCTIADSSLSATNEYCRAWSALSIASGATAQNVVIAGVTNTVDGLPCPPTGTVANFLDGAFDGDASALPAGTVPGTVDDFFPRHADAAAPLEARYRPAPGSPLRDAGADYAPMAAFDLSGRQPRLVGAAVDIGCYEDTYLAIEATGEPTVGLDSFATDFTVGSDVPAAVSIVWSADASFAAAATNTVAEGVTNGVHEASIGGLEPDTLYWWKLVADNGIIRVETAPASFRTLGAPTFDEVSETVSGPTAVFSVGLASLARDELGNGLRTYVTAYYTTNGTDYVELSLGSATRARMLAGSATLPNGDCTWYARAYADYGGHTIEARTGFRTFRVFHNATPPAGFHRLDATISYQGEAAEDIPLLLRLSESIEGFRYADVANNGKDFLFSDRDGNLLPFEIDTWNPAGESLVWVRVPVFTNGAVVHLDYGASEADGTADAADVWRRYV
ncbi:MAG: DUF2341 domain-containing protein, partial [Kiritimatiellae bacterium]|nr:DUF2341 domain-containing protein [Kiritimatiellia bacterium]